MNKDAFVIGFEGELEKIGVSAATLLKPLQGTSMWIPSFEDYSSGIILNRLKRLAARDGGVVRGGKLYGLTKDLAHKIQIGRRASPIWQAKRYWNILRGIGV